MNNNNQVIEEYKVTVQDVEVQEQETTVNKIVVTKVVAEQEIGVVGAVETATIVVESGLTSEKIAEAKQEISDGVARIGTKYYSTLKAAIDDAESGATIELLKSITISSAPNSEFPKYAVLIEKSLTLNGNGYTITAGTDRVVGVWGSINIDVILNNITLKSSSNSSAQGMWIGDNINKLTLNSVIVDNTAASDGYIQAITISYSNDSESVRNIEINNSKILNKENIGYTLIFYAPVNMIVNNSEIAGWSDLYFKNSSNGSNVTINGGRLISVGISGGSWNNFGLINFENANCTIEINDADISVSTEATDTYQSLVSYSTWYGPNTGNTVTITGGKVTLTGDKAIYVIENGTENKLIIDDAIINGSETTSDYSYISPELSNMVAYMYTTIDYNNEEVVNCAGYYEINEYIEYSNSKASPIFEDGEWFEFYNDVVTLTSSAVFNIRGGNGTFGFIMGESSFVA